MGLNLKYTGDPNHEIACPNCGGMNLHHSLVTTFWREKEDSDHGLCVQSGRPDDGPQSQDREISVETITAMAGNPSSRRDGVEILFWCENCHATPRLLLAQHKGTTELQWATPIAVSAEKT
jgi:hypothetical protein